MKWKTFRIGDTRITTRFLLFPLSDGYTTKWLEVATWKESYSLSRGKPLRWINIGWIKI